MYFPDGSWAPSVPLTADPPGIPGSPWPAVPNDLPRLELRSVPTDPPTTGFTAFTTAEAGPSACGNAADGGTGAFTWLFSEGDVVCAEHGS